MAEFVNFVSVMNQKQFKVVEILVQTYHITDDYGTKMSRQAFIFKQKN